MCIIYYHYIYSYIVVVAVAVAIVVIVSIVGAIGIGEDAVDIVVVDTVWFVVEGRETVGVGVVLLLLLLFVYSV